VLEAMMLFQQAKKHAQAAQDRAKAAQDQVKAAKKVALEAEKDNDAAQKELQELQRVMEPKRARTNATTANDHEECDEQSSGDMDIADYRREAARIQKRRSVALGSREDVPTPQKGQAGPLEHPRLGLVGWIAYWSLGNCALAVKIIVGLIRKLNLTESVSEALTPIATKREVETNAKIVMLMKAGLSETKHCRTEQQRQEFHIGLSYVMPPRDEARSKDGMIRRICEQLDVRRGKRLDGRQFAAEWVAKALPSVKPGVWGCVQARTQWSTEEDAHMRPGHHWLCEFGDAGNGTSCERQFNLGHRQCEDYRGTRFYNKDSALVIKR
jgi:hypothetical protein